MAGRVWYHTFDGRISPGKQDSGNDQAERPGRLEINHEFGFRRRLNGKIRRLRTAKHATGIFRGTPVTDTEQS